MMPLEKVSLPAVPFIFRALLRGGARLRDGPAKCAKEQRPITAQHADVKARDALEERAPARGEAQKHFAAVLTAVRAVHQAARFETIRQLDSAVMTNEQATGKRANIGRSGILEGAESQQGLMLVGFEAGAASGLLAEIKEAAQLEAEVGESGVVHC